MRRMHEGRYPAPDVRRVYIPKADGRRRPLGILTVLDRAIQGAASRILNEIYEQDFLSCSSGFRPGLGCHNALATVGQRIHRDRTYVAMEVDIRDFLGTINHGWGWMMKFLEHRVGDRRMLKLRRSWLKAGVMEEGRSKLDELPCVKVEFASESEARRHIFATNKHRKQVKLPPPDVMMSMFPPDEYPLMYADFRANYAYDSVSDSEMSSGHITSEEREKARKKRENERKTQADLRKQAGELLGYTPEFTKQIVTKVAKKAKPQNPSAKVRELTAAEIKQRERLERKLETLRVKIAKKDTSFESLKSELSQLRKDEKKLTRELGKLS